MGRDLASIAIKRLHPSQVPTPPMRVFLCCCWCTYFLSSFAEWHGFQKALCDVDALIAVLCVLAFHFWPGWPVDATPEGKRVYIIGVCNFNLLVFGLICRSHVHLQ